MSVESRVEMHVEAVHLVDRDGANAWANKLMYEAAYGKAPKLYTCLKKSVTHAEKTSLWELHKASMLRLRIQGEVLFLSLTALGVANLVPLHTLDDDPQMPLHFRPGLATHQLTTWELIDLLWRLSVPQEIFMSGKGLGKRQAALPSFSLADAEARKWYVLERDSNVNRAYLLALALLVQKSTNNVPVITLYHFRESAYYAAAVEALLLNKPFVYRPPSAEEKDVDAGGFEIVQGDQQPAAKRPKLSGATPLYRSQQFQQEEAAEEAEEPAASSRELPPPRLPVLDPTAETVQPSSEVPSSAASAESGALQLPDGFSHSVTMKSRLHPSSVQWGDMMIAYFAKTQKHNGGFEARCPTHWRRGAKLQCKRWVSAPESGEAAERAVLSLKHWLLQGRHCSDRDTHVKLRLSNSAMPSAEEMDRLAGWKKQ